MTTEYVWVPREPDAEMVRAGTLGGLLTPNQASASFQAAVIAAPALPAVDEAMVERLATWFTAHAMSLFRQDGRPVDASLYLDHARAALTAALSGPTINVGGTDSKLIDAQEGGV